MKRVFFIIIIFSLQSYFLFSQDFQIKYGLYNKSNQLTDTTKILFSDSINFRIDWLNDERPYSLIILHNDTFVTLFRNKKVYFVEKYKEIEKGNDNIKTIFTKQDSVILDYKVLLAKVLIKRETGKNKEYDVWYLPNKDFIATNAGTPFSNIPGLIIIKKDNEKQITEKIISFCNVYLPIDLFKIPKEYKYFKGNKM